MSILTPEQLDFYWRQGYLILPDVFRNHLEPVRQRLDEIVANRIPGTKIFIRWHKNRQPAFIKIPQLIGDPVFNDLARSAALCGAIADIIGPPNVFRDVVVGKPPRTGSPLRYHQDAAYWDAKTPDTVLSAWIALDNAPVEAGCLRFIPGSHLTNFRHDIFLGNRRLPSWITRILRNAVSLTGTGDNPKTIFQRLFKSIKDSLLGSATRLLPILNDFNEISVDPSIIALNREVSVPVHAGDVILFHSRALHASGANTSESQRRAYIVTYIGSTDK